MRHARPAALDELEPLLVRVRELDGLVERNRGVFSRRSKAFLHFHEDPSGLHADVRLSTEFERFRVETQAERNGLLQMIEQSSACTFCDQMVSRFRTATPTARFRAMTSS